MQRSKPSRDPFGFDVDGLEFVAQGTPQGVALPAESRSLPSPTYR
jgi:hypothetical protein